MKLILGAVQFGMKYGIANRDGKPALDEAFKTFDVAWSHGVRTLDSAQTYGQANEIIGKYHATHSNRFLVINKILRHPQSSADVLSSLSNELKIMKIDCFDCIMFHHAASVPKDFSKSFLDDLETAQITERVGLSIERPQDYYALHDRFHFDVVQLPLNFLNQNFMRDEFLDELKRNNIEIHARSAFLQGLLLEDVSSVPSYLKDLKPNINSFQKDCIALGITFATACLLYLLEKKVVDHIVIGAQNAVQMQQIIEAYKSGVLALEQGKTLPWASYAAIDYDLISPVSWLKHTKN